MPASTNVRRLAATAGLAVAAATLTAAPAEAAPVFFSAEADSDTFAHDDGSDCTATETSSPDATDVPVVENGPAVSYTGSGSATYQNDGVGGDTASASTTATVTTKITSVGSNLGTIDVTVQGTGAITTALPTSDCVVHAGVGSGGTFGFAVTQPGWLTVEADMTRNTYTSFSLSTPDNPYLEDHTYDFTQSSTRKVFLPAGLYGAYTEAYLDLTGSTTKSIAGEATLHASFAVAGAQTEAPKGKGTKYVTLAARSCTTNAIAAAVTGNAKPADRINFVAFFVNGKKVLRDDSPAKGEAYSLPVAGDLDAEVTARVKLVKPGPGIRPKTREVTSSYIACS